MNEMHIGKMKGGEGGEDGGVGGLFLQRPTSASGGGSS